MVRDISLHERMGPHTFEDFCERVGEDQKADLINGVIYLASPETTDTNQLFLWLMTLLNLYTHRNNLGQVFGCRVAFRLSDKHGPEPDLAFVHSDHLDRVEPGWVNGPADLVVEMVSPDSVERDYYLKRELYQECGIPEYWIIDEMDEKVTLLSLKGGKYREVRARKGVLASTVLPGFWLRPEWLWQAPRPDEIETLAEIEKG